MWEKITQKLKGEVETGESTIADFYCCLSTGKKKKTVHKGVGLV